MMGGGTSAGAPLILASASPRRRDLLREAGVEFEVVAPDEAEPLQAAGEEARAFARRAAWAKATQVARRQPGRLALGADTIVVLDGEVLGKPQDEAEARAMLARLAGRTHHVYTGVALARAHPDGGLLVESAVAQTRVTFRRLTADDIAAYVGTREPLDKAGAYGIQGLGARLVAGYEGSYTNVVGLPMEAVSGMLSRRCRPVAGRAMQH